MYKCSMYMLQFQIKQYKFTFQRWRKYSSLLNNPVGSVKTEQLIRLRIHKSYKTKTKKYPNVQFFYCFYLHCAVVATELFARSWHMSLLSCRGFFVIPLVLVLHYEVEWRVVDLVVGQFYGSELSSFKNIQLCFL